MLNKKTITLIMTGVLTLGSCVPVMASEINEQAETEEVIVYDMTTMDEDYTANATWYSLFDSIDLCIPSDWNTIRYAELNDESVEDYIYFEAANADENETVKISYDPSYEFSSTKELADYISESDMFSAYEMALVNDIECVALIGTDDDGNSLKGLATLDSEGGVLLVTCTCFSDEVYEEFDSISNNMLVSFSLAE